MAAVRSVRELQGLRGRSSPTVPIHVQMELQRQHGAFSAAHATLVEAYHRIRAELDVKDYDCFSHGDLTTFVERLCDAIEEYGSYVANFSNSVPLAPTATAGAVSLPHPQRTAGPGAVSAWSCETLSPQETFTLGSVSAGTPSGRAEQHFDTVPLGGNDGAVVGGAKGGGRGGRASDATAETRRGAPRAHAGFAGSVSPHQGHSRRVSFTGDDDGRRARSETPQAAASPGGRREMLRLAVPTASVPEHPALPPVLPPMKPSPQCGAEPFNRTTLEEHMVTLTMLVSRESEEANTEETGAAGINNGGNDASGLPPLAGALGARSASAEPAMRRSPKHAAMFEPSTSLAHAHLERRSSYTMSDASLKSNSAVVHRSTLNFDTDAAGFAMLNGYTILDEIGSGAAGKVVLVSDALSSQLFAVKRVRRKGKTPWGGASAAASKTAPAAEEEVEGKVEGGAVQLDADFKREVAIMRKLRHPNLVRLHEVIDDGVDEFVFLVMDYVKGAPIVTVDFANNKLTPRDDAGLTEAVVQKHFRAIAFAIKYLHKHRIAHLDISFNNIILNDDNEPIIIDFGVSHHEPRQECDATRTPRTSCSNSSATPRRRTAFGTPVFFSPEVARGVAGEELDVFAADIWALGVVLYGLLFRALPFHATSLSALKEKICHDFLVIPPARCSNDARMLLCSMLCKDPARRATISDVCRHPFVANLSLRGGEACSHSRAGRGGGCCLTKAGAAPPRRGRSIAALGTSESDEEDAATQALLDPPCVKLTDADVRHAATLRGDRTRSLLFRR